MAVASRCQSWYDEALYRDRVPGAYRNSADRRGVFVAGARETSSVAVINGSTSRLQSFTAVRHVL